MDEREQRLNKIMERAKADILDLMEADRREAIKSARSDQTRHAAKQRWKPKTPEERKALLQPAHKARKRQAARKRRLAELALRI
jgi:hypothetical protein